MVLFESLQLRPLLLLFPNTFEYFFIWYEAVKLWWYPRKLSRTAVVSAAAGIWIIVKLPQEYWLHIAQNDMTDTVKALPVSYTHLDVYKRQGSRYPAPCHSSGSRRAAAW